MAKNRIINLLLPPGHNWIASCKAKNQGTRPMDFCCLAKVQFAVKFCMNSLKEHKFYMPMEIGRVGSKCQVY